MPSRQVFKQSIQIRSTATIVEQCITERDLMHQWLNPALKCDPVGDWNTEVGSRFRFIVQVPLLQPALDCIVVEREPGLIVWGFDGFFKGCDRWECQPEGSGTLLVNQFEFEIPNPLIKFGFNQFAASWTKIDMEAQLRRLKQVAERPR
ncbi:MAG: SRPBCC family protein [Microcoleaceae cyanobacterium]